MGRSMKTCVVAFLGTLLTLSVSPAGFCAEELTLDALVKRFGGDLATAQVNTETLAPGIHVMRATGGAVLATIGDDGVLLIDDQYPQTAERIQATINELGGGDVNVVLNTHGHFDHANGNEFLGPAGARILAHENARTYMTETRRLDYGDVYYRQPPASQAALPEVTFDDGITLFFNGQRIDVQYYGPGHTDGDVVAYLRGANVAHVGDLYSGGYPYIDANNGGSLAGLVAIWRCILEEIDDETKLVSGHAPVADRAAAEGYLAMLETVHGRLTEFAARGADILEVVAAAPTAEFDEQRGMPTLFLAHAYQTVQAEQ
ncbi:MAG: MBL fold metallo-hydrolase [Pseudomonadota bacterium]